MIYQWHINCDEVRNICLGVDWLDIKCDNQKATNSN